MCPQGTREQVIRRPVLLTRTFTSARLLRNGSYRSDDTYGVRDFIRENDWLEHIAGKHGR